MSGVGLHVLVARSNMEMMATGAANPVVDVTPEQVLSARLPLF
jgi:hypothetical protein